jgi:hypothetical protein
MPHAMKTIFFSALFIITTGVAQAQLSVSPNQTAAYLTAQLLATAGTSGIVVSNEVLTCDSLSNGEFTGISNLGISNGIVLGTGHAASDSLLGYTGIDGLPSQFASAFLNTAGDTQLQTIVGATTYDACVLEFDLQPVGSFIEFEYVFGSEEYPEFNCSPFNDVFGFFISGPGYANPTNIALLPGTSIPVSINTINDGSSTLCTADTTLYVTNTDTISTLDGFTDVLVATATVTPGLTYHLKLAIADVSDGILNSYVLLKANSLKSGGTIPSALPTASAAKDTRIFPSIIQNELYLQFADAQDWTFVVQDLYGRVMKQFRLAERSGIQSIDLSMLPAAQYVVTGRHADGGSIITHRIIKQ